MLIYEYLPNKGLDSFIFGKWNNVKRKHRKVSNQQRHKQKFELLTDKTQSTLLGWRTRYQIIIGIARGLLYLHQDSRLRIIHRDLKVNNILLDADMNPKISNFGTARSFGGNQIEAHTNRVVGTRGYMAPEYAEDGTFSIKSDIHSFGVLILEIVCGEKNRRFAWGLQNEGNSLQLVDKCLGELIDVHQVLRSIHVGLLCAQNHPEDRPTMTSVMMMLESKGPLPSPKEPGFYVGKFTDGFYEGLNGEKSINELSITILSDTQNES
ncbi:putative protein kinase RLK-Pelle-DLSV family [Helianthus annuus]|nr:putative protein kinase RLK-Pelle-DLSV family [Helianthus annuus]KAJ0500682.1 putative protein kinase RLK-Pelle-DLSV family [Helianthus annuus]KAJ0508269.1 putative protein kinase RLK-Pelle-DLSV family [Helianthus annuus]KAJ0516561.1 putative protein kinase RLK-Pelle-DLSV family [Helianthus annuus]KAJ0688505.1 putative protein kinase RLK-Pelle-DLSV family [Helianthus annuus]